MLLKKIAATSGQPNIPTKNGTAYIRLSLTLSTAIYILSILLKTPFKCILDKPFSSNLYPSNNYNNLAKF